MSEEKKPENPTIAKGWTLRDEFANSAMQAICTNPELKKGLYLLKEPYPFIAKESYKIADAMLKQREL